MAFMGGGAGAEAAKLIISLAVNSSPAMKALGDIQGKLASVGSGVKEALGSPFERAMLAFGNIGDAADGIRSVGGAINSIVGPMIMGAAKMETFAMQFEVLLGSADAAKARMADLSDFAATTPFELPGVVEASRLLQTFTDGALASGEGLRMVGDIAAGTGKPIEDVAFKVGRMYDAFRSGTNIGESLMYLQEMGAISGETRRKIENLAASVKSGAMTMEDAWALATQEFGKFGGMTEKLAGSTEGKLSTAIDAVNMALAKLGEKLLPMVKTALDGVVVAADIFTAVAEKAAKYWFLLAPVAIAAGKALFIYAKNSLLAAGATTILGMSMKTLWKAVLGPIGLIIAALEVFSLAWESDFLGLRTIVEGVFGWLKQNFGWLIDIFGQVAQAIGGAIGWITGSVEEFGRRVPKSMTEVATSYAEAGRAVEFAWASTASSLQTSVNSINTTAASASSAAATYIRDNYVAEELAAKEKSIRNAARQSLGTIPDEARKAREALIREMQTMTAQAVTEALNQRKALADAASGAMDTATAEGFAKRAVAATKRDMAEIRTALSDNEKAMDEIRKGGVTKAEQAQLAALKVERAGLWDRLAAAKLAYDKSLADLTQWGDNASRIARIKAAAQTGAYAAGLASKDDLVRVNTLMILGNLYREAAKLEGEADDYGERTIKAWARGMKRATTFVVNTVGDVVEAARGGFKADSPPGPESPLHKIDVWGFRTGVAWAEGLAQGVATLDLSSMPGAGAFAAAGPAVTGSWMGGGPPSGVLTGSSALGGGSGGGGNLTLQLAFSSTVPYTPLEQTQLGQRVGPAVYEYLRGRGVV